MREITHHRSPGLNGQIKLEVADDAGRDHGHRKYQFFYRAYNEWVKGGRIDFQSGPLETFNPDGSLASQASVNGVTNEALIAVLIDRLECFQKGPYSCQENREAQAKLWEALFWLRRRSEERASRGVEGQAKP